MSFRRAMALVFVLGVPVQVATVPPPIHAQQTPGELKGARSTTISPRLFRWQRTITPPPSSPVAEACVVLDADTFANAAPALRDLRLYQDGNELPFAIEQSFDERALASGITPADDRSLYELSASGDLHPIEPSGIIGHARSEHGHRWIDGQPEYGLGFYENLPIPAHVPIERIRIEPALTAPEHITVTAGDTRNLHFEGGNAKRDVTEFAEGSIAPPASTFPFTVGANLQNDAEIDVTVAGSNQLLHRVVFEMRRRSLCYQPRSASPLTLYLGGGNTMPAQSYSFARTFQSARERPTANLGPLLPNPLFHPPAPPHPVFTRSARLTIALLAFVALLLFNAQRLLGKYRRRAH